MDNAMQDTADQTSPDDQDTGGIRIYIDCASDGSFEVGSMPVPQNDDADAGNNEQQVSSIGDALKVVLSLYRENSPADSTAQQQFQAGYQKAAS